MGPQHVALWPRALSRPHGHDAEIPWWYRPGSRLPILVAQPVTTVAPRAQEFVSVAGRDGHPPKTGQLPTW